MFKDSKQGQTNYCTHENNSPSGICDGCLPKTPLCVQCQKELKKSEISNSTSSYVSYLFHCYNPDCPNNDLLQEMM